MKSNTALFDCPVSLKKNCTIANSDSGPKVTAVRSVNIRRAYVPGRVSRRSPDSMEDSGARILIVPAPFLDSRIPCKSVTVPMDCAWQTPAASASASAHALVAIEFFRRSIVGDTRVGDGCRPASRGSARAAGGTRRVGRGGKPASEQYAGLGIDDDDGVGARLQQGRRIEAGGRGRHNR